jgi:hypothetical protein
LSSIDGSITNLPIRLQNRRRWRAGKNRALRVTDLRGGLQIRRPRGGRLPGHAVGSPRSRPEIRAQTNASALYGHLGGVAPPLPCMVGNQRSVNRLDEPREGSLRCEAADLSMSTTLLMS